MAKLAGRTSGTEHSVPRRYTSLAMRSLRRVVRTPPGPRFHAVGDRPVAFTQAEARRDSPAGWPWPQKVTARHVTADATRMLSAVAWERAGSRPVMPTLAPDTARPIAVILPCRLDLR